MPDRKKIILFIVEGINDETSLAIGMSRFLQNESVHFEVTRGDITAERGSTPNNIAAKVGNLVKEFSGRIFKQNDFLEVVHLVDMDGAYVPDARIIQDSASKTIYEESCIKTNKIEKIIARNHQKQEILDKMTALSKVWRSIPYHVYYFSCNLDHVLHDNSNLSREEKSKLADAFDHQFFEKTSEFVEFFNSGEFAVKGSYDETWKFIKAETNSLKRYSNFQIYLNRKNK